MYPVVSTEVVTMKGTAEAVAFTTKSVNAKASAPFVLSWMAMFPVPAVHEVGGVYETRTGRLFATVPTSVRVRTVALVAERVEICTGMPPYVTENRDLSGSDVPRIIFENVRAMVFPAAGTTAVVSTGTFESVFVTERSVND